MQVPEHKHSAFTREVENATAAVMMIHGITGSPSHFCRFYSAIPEDMSIYNLLLNGHGGSVKDFANTSMDKWKAQVSAQTDLLLDRYERIYLVGHSMGTLLSLQTAISRPEKIKGLFLLAVPTRPRVRLRVLTTGFRAARGKESPGTQAMHDRYSIRMEGPVWSYLGWAPRFWELLTEIRRTRRMLPRLRIPTVTFQSQEDELVSIRSVKDLKDHPMIQNTILYESGHQRYSDGDAAQLYARFSEFIKE